MTDRVLVADIGGTNARFALAAIDGAIEVEAAQVFRAEDYASIGDAAAAFLAASKVRPVAACFAVAGPVTDEVIEFTNSRWVLDIAKLRARLGLPVLDVVNDFEALALGVRHLRREDLVSVRPGAGEATAPTLVIGPGTGLGQALLVPAPGGARVVATEGGHVAFAPASDEEIEVLRFLRRDHGRVSIERLLSGPGLVNIHRALCAIAGAPADDLQPDEIAGAARGRALPLAVRTIDLFCAVLGGAVGDAVLATGARGGVFLGGGILPKIREMFLASAFVARFLDKGRMRPFVETVPVDLIIRDGAALLGAASRLKGSDGL